MDQRARIRELERRVAQLERVLYALAGSHGVLSTRPPRILHVKAQELIAAGTTATVVVLDYNASDGDEVETAKELEAFNPWNVDCPANARAVIIECPWQPADRRWHLLVFECS